MGKAAKTHRAKVAKRNANLKVQEKRMQKVWQEAFEEQMNVMKEKFAAMSGDTMSGLTGLLEMFLFIGLLLLGFFYVIKKGALKWEDNN